MKYVMKDTIKSVEQKIAKQWIRGSGPKAEFTDEGQGYWAVFSSCPASMFLGTALPELKAGDPVRLTLERDV